ncbi:MAG: AlpA family phage regulatory protein [Xanthobacteraceae bacterium]
MAQTLQRMLRRKEVELATGLPRSTIYERMAKGKFPRPVFPDGARSARWLEAEIIDWQRRQIAARDVIRSQRKRREPKAA